MKTENLLKRQIAGVVIKETEKAVCIRSEANDESGHKWSVQNFWFPKSSITPCVPFNLSKGNLMANENQGTEILYFDVAPWIAFKAWSGRWQPAYNIVDPHFVNYDQKN